MDTMNGGDSPLILDYDSFFDLAPHYKFAPKEEELVMDFLMPKVRGEQLLVNRIVDIYDIKAHTPRQLYEMNKPKRGVECYFFTSRNKKSKRAAGNGVWRAIEGEDPIRSDDGTDQILGYKRALVFHEGQAPNQTKTDWRMHEYTLAKCGTARKPTAPLCGMPMKLDEWVLCKIYKKNKTTKKSEKKNHQDGQESQVLSNTEEQYHQPLQNEENPWKAQPHNESRQLQPVPYTMSNYGYHSSSSFGLWNFSFNGSLDDTNIEEQYQQPLQNEENPWSNQQYQEAQPQYESRQLPHVPSAVNDYGYHGSPSFGPWNSNFNGSLDDTKIEEQYQQQLQNEENPWNNQQYQEAQPQYESRELPHVPSAVNDYGYHGSPSFGPWNSNFNGSLDDTNFYDFSMSSFECNFYFP